MQVFCLDEAPQVSLHEGQLISHRLVTHENSGSKRLGFHITRAQPNIAGAGTVYPDKDEIIYVIEGSYVVLFEKKKRILGPGEGVFIPAGEVHDWEAGGEGWTIACIFSAPVDLATDNITQEDGSRRRVAPAQ